jgi:hypothetical protein
LSRAGDAEAQAAWDLHRLGSTGERDLDGQRRLGIVDPDHAGDVDDVRGWRHAGEIELADLLDVIEHLGQLSGHPLDLVFAQLEAGKARDV